MSYYYRTPKILLFFSLCIDQKNEYLFERGDSGMEDFMSKISSMFKEGSGSVS